MIGVARHPVDTRFLVRSLRSLDPKLFKPEPLPAGKVATDVTLPVEALTPLARLAASALCGVGSELVPPGKTVVLWRQGASELLVAADLIQISCSDGIVTVALLTSCDQAPEGFIAISFAVGEAARPAGLIAATEERPRGPAEIVDVWGDRLIAFAWRVLLELVTQIAAESGRDEDGAPLLPVAVWASVKGLTVRPMARHPMDRLK